MAVEAEIAKEKNKLPILPFRWALLFAAMLFSGRLAFTVWLKDPHQLIYNLTRRWAMK